MSESSVHDSLVARHSDLTVYCKLAAVTMIWGGTFVAGRYLASGLSPLLAASLRFLLASLALLGFMAIARIPLARPSLRQLGQLAVLGFSESSSTTCVSSWACSRSTPRGPR